jgi:hypothetical protein
VLLILSFNLLSETTVNGATASIDVILSSPSLILLEAETIAPCPIAVAFV